MSPVWPVVGAAAAAFLLRGLAILRGRRERAALAETPLLARLVRPSPPGTAWLRAALLAAGAGALAAAAGAGVSGPPPDAGGGEPETILVLDASNSMRARDVAPSRIERQRRLARRVAAAAPGRLGIVFFAGRGYVLAPVTGDRDAALMYVDAVDPTSVGRGGTAMAAGVRQALDVLAGGEPGSRRAIVLFSDGEATAPDDGLEGLLARAVREGVRVHAVGIGSAAGARIPLPSPAGEGETAQAPPIEPWLRDPTGQPVVTRLEEAALRRIAAATGGLYLPGTDAGVERLLRALAAGEDGPAAARLPVHPLLLLAFLLLWADGFLFRRG